MHPWQICRWKGTTNAKEFAEICRCREAKCRGLIAEKGSEFIEVSTLHYEDEIARLQEHYAVAEKAVQERYEALAAAEQAGSSAIKELEIELIRKENENEKLKARIELMVAAVTRSRASLAEESIVTTYVVEIPQKEKPHVSPLRKLIQRIRYLFSQKEEEVQAEITISETNPCFAPDSPHLSHRSTMAEPIGAPLLASPLMTRLDRKGASPGATVMKRHMRKDHSQGAEEGASNLSLQHENQKTAA
jgi:hypothetical protein